MPAERILLFGGTAGARHIAQALIEAGFAVTTSLAGVTSAPLLPPGDVRRGGFGGTAGIAAFLAAERIAAIVDATHPFAARISHHAHGAAMARRIPYLRYERPPWRPEAGDFWIEVPTMGQAVAAVPPNARVMLTVGRKEIGGFLARPDLTGLARMIEAPAEDLPEGWSLIRARPPFSLEQERTLMAEHRIGILVTKNAGGDETRAKLIAARERKIPVVMVARPAKPEAPSIGALEGLVPALRRMLGP
ncbi:MAG: cobalt-precorrin-6A reductase [Rhizobiales bacterium]|nr:cobalt-precorrin-6A reductase [Hyphomicrobiales bacterium]MBI3674899.1 cobalt-precorrin-6A reductase [Hyphomicrobiales bacterium]